jgi:hypothetical protein
MKNQSKHREREHQACYELYFSLSLWTIWLFFSLLSSVDSVVISIRLPFDGESEWNNTLVLSLSHFSPVL